MGKRITAMVMAIVLTLTVFCSSTFAVESQSGISEDYIKEVLELIKQKYQGNIDEEELMKAAIRGMFDTLDQYSTFYDKTEFDEIYGSLEGSVEGVGIQVQLSDKYVTVLKVFPKSPAQKAGMLSGDMIAEVNGEYVVGKSLEEVISKVKGPEGTEVKVGVIRQGSDNIIKFTMKREKVKIPSVDYEIRGNIGYLHIDSFLANTSREVKEALNYFDKNKITKVILDLRDNPGGLVDQAVEVAQFFVPKGLITTLDYKDPSTNDVKYYSELDKIKYQLAVLVNENTASASEILTGSIKDSNAGVVLGKKTFGKAKVQGFTPILSPEAYERLNADSDKKTVNAIEVEAYESDLLGWTKMTIGMYYTPSGECIDLKGIEPDISVDANYKDGISVNLLKKLSVTVKPSLGSNYYDVLFAEYILKFLGYDIGTPDFDFDKKTFEAVKKFQKDSGVYSYGVLDFSTQKLLNQKLDMLVQTEDAVYARAVKELGE